MTRPEITVLSVTFCEGMPKFPAAWFPEFSSKEVDSPVGHLSRRFTTLELCAHNGTHVESADHVMTNGVTIDTIPLHSFAGFPTIVDLRDVHDGAEVPLETVRDRLRPSDIEPGGILLLMTGYNDRKWSSADFWERSPWLSIAAAEYIASTRPSLIGLDFQTEKPLESEFPIHRVLLAQETVLCEYLFNLERIDARTLFMALPIKVAGVEAAAVRAVGVNGLAGG